MVLQYSFVVVFFFILVAETLKIKREQEKAWEQKQPEGEMTKTSLEVQRMVVSGVLLCGVFVGNSFLSCGGGREQSQPYEI